MGKEKLQNIYLTSNIWAICPFNGGKRAKLRHSDAINGVNLPYVKKRKKCYCWGSFRKGTFSKIRKTGLPIAGDEDIRI